MLLEQGRQAMHQLHLSDQNFITYKSATYIGCLKEYDYDTGDVTAMQRTMRISKKRCKSRISAICVYSYPMDLTSGRRLQSTVFETPLK